MGLPFGPLVPNIATQSLPNNRKDDTAIIPPNTGANALATTIPPTTPTAPLQTAQTTQQSVPPVLNDIATQAELKKPPVEPLKVDSVDELTKRYDLAASRGTSTLQQILSWVGAAKGDFRPLIAIEENKRKTALGRAMIPEMFKIRQMADEGNYDGAIKQMDALSTSFGARANEMLPYFQQVAGDLGKKYDNYKNLQTVATMYNNVPDDHPLASFKNDLNNAVKNRSYISETTLQNLMSRFAPHTQILDGQMVIMNPITGKSTTSALPQVVKAADVDNMVDNQLTAAAKLSGPQDLANVLNGREVTDVDKNVITPGSPKAWQIIGARSQLLKQRSQMQAAANVPITPEFAQKALENNSSIDVALRNFGSAKDITTGVIEQNIAKDVEVKRREFEQDPTTLDKAGFVVLNVDPTADNFGQTPLVPVTMQTVKDSQGKLKAVKQSELPVIRKHYETVQGLAAADTLLSERPGAATVGDFGAAWINNVVQRYTQGNLQATSPKGQAARAIISRTINDMVDSGQVRAEDVANLRQSLAEGISSDAEVRKGVKFLQQYTDARLKQYTGTSLFDDSGELAKSLTPGAKKTDQTGATGQQSQQIDMPPVATATTLNKLSSQYKVDPILTLSIASQESGGRHLDEKGQVKTSGKGAKGVMQLMPGTATKHKVDINDENQNMQGGVAEIAELQKLSKNPKDILAGYVGGVDGMRLYQQGKAGKDITDYVDQTYARYQRLMGQKSEVKTVDKVIPKTGQQTTPTAPATSGNVPSTVAAPVTPTTPAPVGTQPGTSQPTVPNPGIIPGTLR